MSNVDERVWAGIDVMLDDYVRLQANDTVLLAYTPESREPAAWICAALKLRGKNAIVVGMRRMIDETFAERLDAALPPPHGLAGKLAIITVERDTMSHVYVWRNASRRYDKGKWSVTRIINASEDFFLGAMNLEPSELSALNTALLERFMKAHEMRVTTEAGTDLRITLDNERFRWVSNRGSARPGSFVVLPAGEVATFPASVSGVLVADGAFNANAFTRLDARLGRHPVRIRLEESRAVDCDCDSEEVRRLVESIFAMPNARRVGELGFGTNRGMGSFVSMNSHLNERHPGVHLGFGQHNQNVFIVDYECSIHLDMITDGGRVWLDGAEEPLDLCNFEPSRGAHPTLVLDEDIDGDCCGLWLDEEQQRACQMSPPEQAAAMPAHVEA